MNKAYRQAQIAKIIQTRSIFTQEELAAVLAAQGVKATQVTLSRDLRELGVLKTPEGYRGAAAALPAEASKDNLERVLREFLRDVEVAQNLVVLKTQSAGAAAVAEALDAEGNLGITGTVAGDNTIFAAMSTSAAAKRLKRTLLRIWARDRFTAKPRWDEEAALKPLERLS